MICRLALGMLLLTALVSAQPGEGPWVVAESDSPYVFRDVQLGLTDGGAAKIFSMVDVPFSQVVLRTDYSLLSHERLDSVIVGEENEGPAKLCDVAMAGDEWAAAVRVDCDLCYHIRLVTGTDDDWETRDVFYDEGWIWNGVPLTVWGQEVTVEAAIGGGWIIGWGAGELSWYPFEDWVNPMIAFIVGDDINVVPDEWSWLGMTDGMGIYAESVAPDTAVLISTFYGGIIAPSGIRVSTIALPDEEFEEPAIVAEVADCARYAGSFDQVGDHQFATIVSNDYYNWGETAMMMTLDQAGNCFGLIDLDLPEKPNATAWHISFGYACAFVSASQIQIARIEIDGSMPLPVGTVHWRDDLRMITSANIAIADNGDVVVAWTERGDPGTGASSRLMLATVGWETPLAVSPEPSRTAVRGYELTTYPNPFNATTKISFTLARVSRIELRVFDITGRLVKTLTDEALSAGSHAVMFEAQDLPSGIYLCHLKTTSGSTTQKLVLLK